MTGPMTPLEERLTAALDARAHQIHESDLGPAEVPGPSNLRRGVRAGWMVAAAAGIVAVIGVPYAIAQLTRSDVTPLPPSATVASNPDWQIIATDMIDVDGDGTSDPVRIRLAPGGGSGMVEVQLGDNTLATMLPNSAAKYTLEQGADIDGHAGNEVLVSVGSALNVYGLVDGAFVHLAPAKGGPPLMHRVDAQGRLVSWLTDGGRLFTFRSVDPHPTGDTYPVERWRWNLSGASLTAEQVKTTCVRRTEATTLVPCATEVPTEFTWADNTYTSAGDEVTLNFLVGGKSATALLTSFLSGDSQLAVTAGGKTWRAGADASMGAGPRIVGHGITVSPTGDRAVLLSWTTTDSENFGVFGWVDGDLVNLVPGVGDPFLGNGTDSSGPVNLQNETWVQDGWLYTADEIEPGKFQIYRWQQNGSRLEQVPLDGTYCFDATKTGRLCS